jgi:hypothetical protein
VPPTTGPIDPTEPTSVARVSTDRAGRYGKQLASHLGRRAQSEWNEEDGRGLIVTIWSQEDAADAVDRLENVVGRHLVRFGTRDELVVAWTRAGGVPGSVQRKDTDDDGGPPSG